MSTKDSIEPVLQSIAKAERHMKSEYGTRMVGVMDTIAAHPHFAMMLAPGVVKVCSGRDEVDAMYKASVDFAEPRASRIVSQIASDWYMFMENVPTRLWIAEGVERTAQTVNIFVSDDVGGLTGEYAWHRYYSLAQGEAGDTPGIPRRTLENLQLHDDLLAALAAGDGAALARTLDPACLWAQRNYLREVAGGEIMNLQGAEEVVQHVAAWHAAFKPEHVSVLNRRVTDWFVFSEELWVVRPGNGEARQYRTATIYPVNAAGKFEGALGFGQDVSALAPTASSKLGLAFYPPGIALLPSQ